MNTRLLLLPALVLLGCAPKPVPLVAPMAANIHVKVESLPVNAHLTLDGRPIGSAPQTLAVDTVDRLLKLDATHEAGQMVEKRIRFLSLSEAEVSFRFGEGRSEMAKALKLPRILVFDYGAGVTFDFNKASLKADFLPLLQRQADLLKTHFAGVEVHVCGHTDTQGRAERNLELSLERAQAVTNDLVARGVAKGILKVQGFGSAYPVAGNETDAGRALNRRTELILGQ